MRPLLLIAIVLLLSFDALSQEDGKSLFQSNCAQCHNPIRVITGPALKGITERVTDRKLLHDWIHNNNAVLASGNTYFNDLYNSYGRAPMNIFPNLSDTDIDAILKYIENYAAPLAATNSSNYAPHPEQDDHTTLFGIVTFILAIFVGGLYLVNINLKRLADEKFIARDLNGALLVVQDGQAPCLLFIGNGVGHRLCGGIRPRRILE